MDPSQIVELVKQKKRVPLQQPGAVRADAAPALMPLLNDPDPQVRELAVLCLDRAGGAAAAQGLLKALDDRIETISAAAVRGLANHYTAAEIPAIRVQMGRNPNEYVREHLALLLGKTGDASNTPILGARRPVEKDEHAAHAIGLAMARLGDPASKHELSAHLQSGNVAQRVAALQDLPYVNDRSLLAGASPLLDDQRPGLNIGTSHGPYFMRVCDVVVMVAGEMLGRAFSFETGRRLYTPEELAEARRVLATL
jgi:HEAT repeat protein